MRASVARFSPYRFWSQRIPDQSRRQRFPLFTNSRYARYARNCAREPAWTSISRAASRLRTWVRGVEAGLEKREQLSTRSAAFFLRFETRIALETDRRSGILTRPDLRGTGIASCAAAASRSASAYALIPRISSRLATILAATRESHAVRGVQKTHRFERLAAIHMNDSKAALGSRVDRHEHIGKGRIGLKAFRYIMRERASATFPKSSKRQRAGTWRRTSSISLRFVRSCGRSWRRSGTHFHWSLLRCERLRRPPRPGVPPQRVSRSRYLQAERQPRGRLGFESRLKMNRNRHCRIFDDSQDLERADKQLAAAGLKPPFTMKLSRRKSPLE